ncbi:hypothetical protein K458DRAFT_354854 [Lentithecium fluviatile CBS 122367]|uniref:BTB domain-containing protein n=1 Tax=Lentithecium fluviatile CBS 122367 TaxID=1168545 RepID=A0A6G1JKC1_9PLEO|nr:hypothetical protein K458DRAFT_354854 [Lentithecium fluviatile CBS 122367]
MAEAPHEIDPSADTILVLKDPNAPFAVWNELSLAVPKVEPSQKSTLTSQFAALGSDDWSFSTWGKSKSTARVATNLFDLMVSGESNDAFNGQGEGEKVDAATDDWGITPKKSRKSVKSKKISITEKRKKKGKLQSTATEVADDASSSTALNPGDVMESSSIPHESLFGGRQPSIPEAGWSSTFDMEAAHLTKMEEHSVTVEEEVGVCYYVSSRHLALGSEFFKSSLTKNGWAEGQSSTSDGKYHLWASDWDPEAFLILLNVLHLRNRQVPRSLTLEMLAKMAVLVDYYRCGEAVDVFSEMWIDSAKKTSPVPSTYGRDLVLWMCIAWVFKLPVEFGQTTNIAFRQSKTPTIQDMCLPIPKLVLDGMEHKRCQAIEDLVTSLYGWLDKFRGNSHACVRGSQYKFACSSMLLGALTKEMDCIGCWAPRPEIPFEQMSFDELYKGIQAMKSPVWSPSGDRYNYGSGHPCGFQNTVKNEVNQIERELAGLNLGDFKDRGHK